MDGTKIWLLLLHQAFTLPTQGIFHHVFHSELVICSSSVSVSTECGKLYRRTFMEEE